MGGLDKSNRATNRTSCHQTQDGLIAACPDSTLKHSVKMCSCTIRLWFHVSTGVWKLRKCCITPLGRMTFSGITWTSFCVYVAYVLVWCRHMPRVVPEADLMAGRTGTDGAAAARGGRRARRPQYWGDMPGSEGVLSYPVGASPQPPEMSGAG